MRLPTWIQDLLAHQQVLKVSIVILPSVWTGEEREGFVRGLNYGEGFEALEWVLRNENWAVGCPPGLAYLVDDKDVVDIVPPDWAFFNA